MVHKPASVHHPSLFFRLGEVGGGPPPCLCPNDGLEIVHLDFLILLGANNVSPFAPYPPLQLYFEKGSRTNEKRITITAYLTPHPLSPPPILFPAKTLGNKH